MIAVQKPLLIALAVLLFFVFNAFNHLVFKDARLDLTEGQLYTLSEGSLNLVQGIEEPVQVYFFFSEMASRDLTPIRTYACLLYTSPSPRDLSTSRMPSSA